MITVLFRVNGSADIGLGHVMRCLTLAEQLRQFSVKCVFLSSTSNLSQLFSEKGFDHHNLGLISNTEEKGIEQEDAEQCLHFISEYRVDIMVVDHYGLTEVWDKYVRPKVSNLVVIDDLVSTVHQCDFLINSHPQVKPEDYKKLVSIDTKLLLGHDFVLLRDEFLKKRDMAINKRESTTTISKILVSIGATDPNQFSLNVLSILNDIKFDGDVILLISSECQWIHSIKLDQNFSFVLDVRINTNSVSDLLVDVDLAIGSIGVSSWERCFLGLPSIVLVTADNQLNLASYLEIEGLAYLASMETIADKLYSIVNGKIVPSYKDIYSKCFQLFDGKGAYKISKALLLNGLNIETLTYEDSDDLYRWQNQDGARNFSRNSMPPSFSEHDNWICKKLINPAVRMWVIKLYGTNVGYVRLDDHKTEEEVSILLSKEFRGLSLGRKSIAFINRQSRYKRVKAHVHPDNLASVSLFLSCGYILKNEKNLIWQEI